MIVFKLRDGFHSKIPAQIIGERITELKKRNATPERPEGDTSNEEILEDARPVGSPLHNHFTWNESEAARKCNLDEASYLKRCYYSVTIAEGKEPIIINPANVVVGLPDPDNPEERRRRIVGPDYAMKHEDYRAEVLQETMRLLEGIQRRLRDLQGISPAILKALDVARALIEKAAQKKPKSTKAKAKATAKV